MSAVLGSHRRHTCRFLHLGLPESRFHAWDGEFWRVRTFRGYRSGGFAEDGQ